MLTASSLSLAQTCAPALALPQVQTAGTEWTSKGTAVHDFLETAWTVSREAALEKVPKEVRDLCEAVDFAELESFFGGAPRVEVAVAWDPKHDRGEELGERIGRAYNILPGWIPGTMDAIRVSQGRGMLADWKTGSQFVEPPETNAQLRFYALAAARTYDLVAVEALVIRIDDDGDVRVFRHVFDEDELDAIAHEVRTTIEAVDEAREIVARGDESAVTTGSHCRWCRALPHCPGMANAAQALVAMPSRKEELTSESAAIAWQLYKGVESALEHVKGALGAYLAMGGTIELPNGKVVRELERKHEVFIPEKVVEVATEFGVLDEVLARTKTTVTKAALEEIVGKKRMPEFVTRLNEVRGIRTGAPTSGGMRELNKPKQPKARGES